MKYLAILITMLIFSISYAHNMPEKIKLDKFLTAVDNTQKLARPSAVKDIISLISWVKE